MGESTKEGEYNICFVIKEFRNGRLISSTIRDMQILVLPDCKNNLAPIIESIQDTCVVAGSIIQIPIKVFDPNSSGPVANTKLNLMDLHSMFCPKRVIVFLQFIFQLNNKVFLVGKLLVI